MARATEWHRPAGFRLPTFLIALVVFSITVAAGDVAEAKMARGNTTMVTGPASAGYSESGIDCGCSFACSAVSGNVGTDVTRTAAQPSVLKATRSTSAKKPALRQSLPIDLPQRNKVNLAVKRQTGAVPDSVFTHHSGGTTSGLWPLTAARSGLR